MLKVLSNILCDLDPKLKVKGQKVGICDGVPSTSALVIGFLHGNRSSTGMHKGRCANPAVYCTAFFDMSLHLLQHAVSILLIYVLKVQCMYCERHESVLRRQRIVKRIP